MIELYEVPSYQVPVTLLLEGDPSESNIQEYLPNSWCFVANTNQQIIAACVIQPTTSEQAEIFNISVAPDFQQQGIGTGLLKFVIKIMKKREFNQIKLGTGTFGRQLTYYQRLGFRVESVHKDYFINHYDTPIFEDGIQHQDRLWLSLNL